MVSAPDAWSGCSPRTIWRPQTCIRPVIAQDDTAWSAPRFHTLTISDVRRETADAVSLAFAVPARLRAAYGYVPGQYLTLRATIDGEDVRRSYSICSGLDDGELRVVVKQVAGGAFSGWVGEHVRVGDTLAVMTPGGRFGVPIEPGSARTLVAFAAGSGITPVMAILRTVLRRRRGGSSCSMAIVPLRTSYSVSSWRT